VLAGIYLGEYAQDGALVRLVRIGVNNLAGIPSIVYGIFGVGFFIDFLGAQIDQRFYPELLDGGPVFGKGGVLWAALTLGMLTVPVVIVATEEAIRVIPRGVREGSFALGATKFQTLWRVLVPLASPGILTGFILAMARAAGEVAPLMLTGVINKAATLPLDGQFPYFHLERQFMHLGFQLYSVAFQSRDAEAARPLVYVIALLLVLIVLMLSGLAIILRNHMRKTLQIRTI
jgi:phosphate transport system permease protein